jgi:hypothetical protein
LALKLANLGREWKANAAKRMPVASGDIREIIGQPVFIPLEQLFRVYGKIFRLSFGPKNFVIISDPAYAKQVCVIVCAMVCISMNWNSMMAYCHRNTMQHSDWKKLA